MTGDYRWETSSISVQISFGRYGPGHMFPLQPVSLLKTPFRVFSLPSGSTKVEEVLCGRLGAAHWRTSTDLHKWQQNAHRSIVSQRGLL